MKPFHTEIGAVRWLEDNAKGTRAVSVLIVAPVKGKLVTRKCSFFFKEGVWVLAEVQ